MYASNAARMARRAENKLQRPHLCSTCLKKLPVVGKKSCQPCLEHAKKQYIKHKDAYAALGKLRRKESPRRNMARMVSSARRRVGGNITTEEVFQLWVSQDACCALSGIKMTWGGGKLQPNSLSMDRIDPTDGYHAKNVRLVCHAVNMFRGQMNDVALLEMAKAIVNTLHKIGGQ